MRKILSIFIAFICITVTIKAQTICHTTSIETPQTKAIHYSNIKSNNSGSYYLKTYFHVIRKNDGSGGQSYSNVESAFVLLNEDYNKHNIFFVWDRQVDYINNTSIYYSPDTTVFSINSHLDGIDIYLFCDSLTEYNSGGLANGIGEHSELLIGGKYWKTPYQPIATSHVISHEMGHVLGLYHTHHGTYNEGGGGCKEYVDGSNSDVCGDYMVDTPADPCLNYNVDPITYNWLGSGTDAHGDHYAPNTRLIMSYTDIRCMDLFSSQQVSTMKNAIESLPHLQNSIITTGMEGSNIVCSTTTYSLGNLATGYDVDWHFKYNSSVYDSLIIQDYPYTNQCRIRTGNSLTIDNVLIATIKLNGQDLVNIEKPICKNSSVHGTYSQEGTYYHYHNYPSINNSSFGPLSTIGINPGCLITIVSPNFKHMHLTDRSSYLSFLLWEHDGNDTLKLKVPFYYQLKSFYIVGTDPSGTQCNNFEIKVGIFPDEVPSIRLQMNLKTSQDQIEVSLANLLEDDKTNAIQDWVLDVFNSTSGQLVYNDSSPGAHKKISTSGWTPGIYLFRGKANDNIVTEKISIK